MSEDTDILDMEANLAEPLKATVKRASNLAEAQRMLWAEHQVTPARFGTLLQGAREISRKAANDTEAAEIISQRP